MTKWFSYFEDRPNWTWEDFSEYFDDRWEVFGSWLKTSYEMTVCNNTLWKVTAIVSSHKADYNIVYNDGWSYPAGTVECFGAADLWNGFMDRIDNPDKYTGRSAQ